MLASLHNGFCGCNSHHRDFSLCTGDATPTGIYPNPYDQNILSLTRSDIQFTKIAQGTFCACEENGAQFRVSVPARFACFWTWFAEDSARHVKSCIVLSQKHSPLDLVVLPALASTASSLSSPQEHPLFDLVRNRDINSSAVNFRRAPENIGFLLALGVIGLGQCSCGRKQHLKSQANTD